MWNNLRGNAGRVLGVLAALAAVAVLFGPAPTPSQAVGNPTLSVSAPDRTVNPGDTFTVTVMQDTTGNGATAGTEADIGFDKNLVQVVSVAAAAPSFTQDGAAFTLGVQPQTTAQAIADANSSGVLQNVAAFYTPGTTTVPAGLERLRERNLSGRDGRLGTSPIVLSGQSMIDEFGALVPVNTIVNGSVSVNNPTVRLDPGTQCTTAGSTVKVRLMSDVLGGSTGVQATVAFDQTKLQLTSVAVGYHYTGTSIVTPFATLGDAITNANADGTLNQVAVFFTPPTAPVEGTGTLLDPAEAMVLTFSVNVAATGVMPLALSGAEITDAGGYGIDATTLSAAIGVCSDADGDGVNEPVDNCPLVSNAGQADSDADALGDACEASYYGTDPLNSDTDGDGCKDGREVRWNAFSPGMGGDRDPLNYWDFFDVNATGDIDLSDTLNILGFFGDSGTSPAGNLRDRFAFDSLKRWRLAEADDGVDLSEALANLSSFGHSCN